MPDKFTKKVRSKIMAAIKSKNTKQETEVFKNLRRAGVYFQKHYKKVPGCPDIAVPSKKIAVFIDGDFWHGYRFPKWKKRLGPYWVNKIETNRKRDKRNFVKLKSLGWRYVRVWEHDLKNHPSLTFQKILNFMKN